MGHAVSKEGECRDAVFELPAARVFAECEALGVNIGERLVRWRAG
jgi:hypothetical protein